MIFDTDVLIWVQRGNTKAANIIDKTKERYISILTYMELLQGAKNKNEHLKIKDFLQNYGFIILPISENIGYRAAIYIEEYSLSCGMRIGDALIAATAIENNKKLISGNSKHYKIIKELDLLMCGFNTSQLCCVK